VGEGIILRQNIALNADCPGLADARQIDTGGSLAKIKTGFDMVVMMVPVWMCMGMIWVMFMRVSFNIAF